MGLVSLTLTWNFGGFDYGQRGACGEQRPTYIRQNNTHGMETTPESLPVQTSVLIGYAWRLVVGSRNGMVLRVEPKLNDITNICCQLIGCEYKTILDSS